MARRIIAVLMCVSLLGSMNACASFDPHENFKTTMQQQVGRSADDPYISINRYSGNRGGAVALPDGNVQQEYRFAPDCTVYFNIDKKANKIVGWRYEGSKRACRIAL